MCGKHEKLCAKHTKDQVTEGRHVLKQQSKNTIWQSTTRGQSV